MASLTPQDIDYLKRQAQSRGYDPQNILKIIDYESSGDPSKWGGKHKNYFGLIQFGPDERKKYGVDVVKPSATNQIDATFRFLNDRGYKPNMGLLDLYSTINAGSPGHYKASDGNGTVLSHVAKMQGMSLPQGTPTDAASGQNSIASLIDAQTNKEEKDTKSTNYSDVLGQIGLGLLSSANSPGELLDPAPMMRPMTFNAPIPQTNTFQKSRFRGLLG